MAASTWSCPVCTFINNALLPACEMCESPRLKDFPAILSEKGPTPKKKKSEHPKKSFKPSGLTAAPRDEETKTAAPRANFASFAADIKENDFPVVVEKKPIVRRAGPKIRNAVLLFNLTCLRVHDCPALTEAVKHAANNRGSKIYPLFIYAPHDEEFAENRGGAAMLFVRESLRALDQLLGTLYGVAKIYYLRAKRSQTTASVLVNFCHRVSATAVFTSKRYDTGSLGESPEVLATKKDGAVRTVTVSELPGYLLVEPHLVARHRDAPKKSNRFSHFATLTDFVRMSEAVGHRDIQQASKNFPELASKLWADPQDPHDPQVLSLDELGLYRRPCGGRDWGSQLVKHWKYGEQHAFVLLQSFLRAKFPRYEKDRSLTDSRNTSSTLSPYLHFGVLSIRLLYKSMLEAGGYQTSKTAVRRLVWRDLAYFQLFIFPKMAKEPIRSSHKAQWWRSVTRGSEGAAMLKKWQKGRTGFPIVDAGMRELWATGWMQQNVRMVCAQFLTDVLRVSWVEGAAWFADTLVDADSAINAMMWQNAGRSGIDQWNFFLSPVTNGKSSDPRGDYIKRWCPELRSVPVGQIHTPWKLGGAGGYPAPMVDPKKIKAIADGEVTAEMLRVKQLAGPQWSDAKGYDLVALPLCMGGGKVKIFTRERYRLAHTRNGWEAPYLPHRDGRKKNTKPHGKQSPSGGSRSQKSINKFFKKVDERELAMVSSARGW